ncbi:MAG TPA: cupin domain-containing protein [Vicinamibacterales bacterium]|nr:cupin domain-containing protein [Vicinamibacterales bacterium]
MSSNASKIVNRARSTTPRWWIMAMCVVATAVVSAQRRAEYRTTAKQQEVLKSQLASVPGKEGTVLRVELPAGWVGDWHYHTGDVFVYVISGEFVVDVDGQGRQRFGAGQVYHEAVNTTMQARNGSATQSTELILFQVGGKGEPLMLVAKPPRG